MAKKVILILFLSFIVCLLACAAMLVFTPREKMLNFLSEPATPVNTKVDVYFVFSGGFFKNKRPGRSTRERLKYLKKLLSKNPKTPFVFLDYKSGKGIIRRIMPHKYKNLSFESFYTYDETIGGTENNILELISFLKRHPDKRKIGLITSAYHEKRVKIILNHYLKKAGINNIKIYFFHNNNNQEILTCSKKRYFSLIIHELGGITYFKVKSLF